MLRVLLLFLILIAGLVLGPLLAGHQGYVLIQTDHYNVETTITSLVVMIIALYAVLFALEWIVRRILRTSHRTKGWFLGRKRQRAHKYTNAALLKLAEGDHLQVEKLLMRNADHAEQPVVNYLLAAEAAQQRGDNQRIQQYLDRATALADDDQLPVDITRVRIQLAQGEYHAARHGIGRLLDLYPRHPEVLRLAKQAYLHTSAYSALLDILPVMHKMQLLGDDELLTLQHQAYIGLMDTTIEDNQEKSSSEALKRWWYDQSRKLRKDVVLELAVIERFIACGDHNTAQEVALNSLKRHYDQRLVTLLPHINGDAPLALEKALRKQAKNHEATPLIQSTMAQLLAKRGEWQAAADSFRLALAQRPDANDYSGLANVLDQLHQADEATTARHEGLRLTVKQNDS